MPRRNEIVERLAAAQFEALGRRGGEAGAVNDLEPRVLDQSGKLFGLQKLVPVVGPARHRADPLGGFDDGQAELTEEARRIIDLQARDIRGCTIDSVRIIGLSDQDEGNQESSRQLSVRRAEVLAEYLARRASWPRSRFELLATGARGAVTAEGLDVPVRNRARIIAASHAP